MRKQFLDQSPQADHRDEFIGLIRKMGVNERLSRTTIHLGMCSFNATILKGPYIIYFVFLSLLVAIYLLDVFMDNHRIAYDRLATVSICCLLLAAKIEECDTGIPKLANLNSMVTYPCELSGLVALEGMMLKFYEFQMMIPTAATFLEYFIEGIADDCDYDASIENRTRFHSLMAMKRELTDLALEFVDLTLLNVYMMQELPSKMAAACLAAARCTLEVGEAWPYHLKIMTKYSLNEICSQKRQLQLLRFNVMNDMANSDPKNTDINTPDSGYMSHTDTNLDVTDISTEE